MDSICHVPGLTFEECENVRYARDPAFDGVVFIGVTSTRIYCRPVCPVRQPLSRNVRYYPSAASAEEAGFRPCLRCRPEAAPSSAAWSGSRASVTRGLRLISDGALDRGSVEDLAGHLGMGPRQLARLFRKHLGTTPTAAARTSRIQRAKRLIDQTSMTMTEIAHHAGFRSLRSFNEAFQQVYRRPPSSLRRQDRPSPTD
jgi:AraC family transcriptional regulator, regulatory protein of adaptative response / methylated-DNA-[protein]-cysteine methyltransferase